MSIYGVSTANPFALLDEDYEPEPILPEDTPETKARPTPTTRPPPQSDRRGRGRGRGGRRGEGGGPRAHTDEGDFGNESRASRGRFGRGNRGAPVFRGKREYDRRDGTGRGHELEKRQGGGKGNWGVSTDSEFNETDEIVVVGGQTSEDITSSTAVVEATSEGDGGVKTDTVEEAPEGEDSVEKKEQEEVKIEEKQVFTLAEYEEMMKEKNVKMVPSKKEVPVVDTKQFDGMAVLKKSEVGSGFEALEVERIRKKKEKKEKEVSTVEVFFKVGEPVRRGRGRGRGGRSRDFDGESPGQKWSNGTGPSVQDAPRHDSNFGGGGYPSSRGQGRRGRRGRGGRASYGEQVSRQSGPQGVDISSENAFPALI